MKHIMIVGLFLVLGIGFVSAGETPGSDEVNQILFMLEEEKLARDIYSELGEIWNIRIFSNISASEENHRSQVQSLAEAYGIAYPNLEPGKFKDPELQAMYDELLVQGKSSERAAMEVGETVEITDIADIDSILKTQITDDWRDVLERLRHGSENHLSAFRRQLSRY